MNKNFFPEMRNCMVISGVLLIAGSLLRLDPLFSLIAGIAPLVFYHMKVLKPLAGNGLSQNAIDSVYYFGFLVTLTALAISAVAIARGDASADVNSIVYQFGVGLGATAYAVVARMHLNSLVSTASELSAEETMDRYVKRSGELISNLEAASDQLQAFSSKIVTKTIEAAQLAHRQAENRMLDMTEGFADELSKVLAEAKSGIQDVQKIVSDSTFTAAREQWMHGIKSNAAASVELNQALRELTARSRDEAASMQQAAVATKGLQSSIEAMSTGLETLAGKEGALVGSARQLQDLTNMMAGSKDAVLETVNGLEDLADAVADTGPTFRQMKTVTNKASAQLDSLTETAVRMNIAVEYIAKASDAADALNQGLRALGNSLPMVTDHASRLSQQLASASTVSADFGAELSKIPNYAKSIEDLGDRIEDSMERVSEVIDDTVTEASRLAQASKDTQEALQTTNKITQATGSLQEPIGAVNTALSELATSIATVRHALSESTGDLTLSLVTTGKALEDELQKTSGAATQLTDLFNRVAGAVEDHTAQPLKRADEPMVGSA
jgi:chromosome segregation ATPase